MDREGFLLKLLAVIFGFQIAVFSLGAYYCAKNGGIEKCPTLGKHYEQTFDVMIVTTLALLTGSAISKEK